MLGLELEPTVLAGVCEWESCSPSPGGSGIKTRSRLSVAM